VVKQQYVRIVLFNHQQNMINKKNNRSPTNAGWLNGDIMGIAWDWAIEVNY
jgi:hypothetical protein